MRKLHMLVFDDFVAGTTPVNTKTDLNDVLGQNDQLAIQAVVDQVSGTTPTVTVRIQYSADQINWSNKNTTAEINALAVTANQTNVLFGNDAGAVPSLGYVRLQVTLGGSGPPQVHAKIWVTARNQGG